MTDSIVVESELIIQIKEGNRMAFDILVSQYKEKAFALAFSIVGNVEDTKDITQEAFIRVYNGIGKFRQEASFSTWFYRTLVNLSKDYLRKTKYTEHPLSKRLIKDGEKGVLFQIKDLKYSPEGLVLNRELNQMINLAISKLPQKQRLAFILKHLQGIKTDEIARILNCAQATVKVHLFRAVRNLQRDLQPYLKEIG
jgi:RNA polymerase sigma-70 factor (ECF subfamily)